MTTSSLVTFRNLSHYDQEISHFVSNRLGGHSKGPYDSLNLSIHVGDDPETVNENRFLVKSHLKANKLQFMKQVHGSDVCVIGKELTKEPEADALISNVPGIGLAALVADCVPVLLYDPLSKAIAAIHSGWKSTAGNISGKTIKALSENYGTESQNLIAGIGPSICQSSFETGLEVKDRLAEYLTAEAKWISPHENPEKVYINLQEVISNQLKTAGVSPKNIEILAVDTMTSEKYFSARRMGFKSGRQAACIALKQI